MKTIQLKPNEITPAQFEEAMARYAAAGLRGLEITKAIEAEINEVFERYQDELQCVTQSKDAAYDLAQAYCLKHKSTLFSKRRSLGTAHGTAGFRLGTPRIKVKKGMDWQVVMQRLKDKLPTYVRTVEEPARSLILADRNKENLMPLLAEVGIEVVQEELFFIEEKKAA